MKKKILIVNGHMNVGGVEKSLLDLLRCLDYEKYSVDLLLFEGLGDYSEEIPHDVNIIYKNLNNTHGSFFRSLKRSLLAKDWLCISMRIIFLLQQKIHRKFLGLARKKILHDKSYDVAMAYRMGFCTKFVNYAVRSKVKITWWHNSLLEFPEKEWLSLKEDLELTDKVVVVSGSYKKQLIKKFRITNDNVYVIGNSIDINSLVEKSKKQVVSFKSGVVNIASVSRLEEEKQIGLCALACKELIKKGYEINWHIVGDGSKRKCIEKIIEENNLSENVFLYGKLDNPYPILAASDIFVHPARIESFGIVILEALALGIPSVVVNSLGPSEYLVNRENALVIPNSLNAVVDGVEVLINDKDLFLKLKQKDSNTLERYSPERIVEQIESLF